MKRLNRKGCVEVGAYHLVLLHGTAVVLLLPCFLGFLLYRKGFPLLNKAGEEISLKVKSLMILAPAIASWSFLGVYTYSRFVRMWVDPAEVNLYLTPEILLGLGMILGWLLCFEFERISNFLLKKFTESYDIANLYLGIGSWTVAIFLGYLILY